MFRAYLPRLGAGEAASTVLSQTRVPLRGGSETILLVEDEVRLRTLARKTLAGFGYKILEAGTGSEAVALWQQHSNDIKLLITDLVMPGDMTGRELGERLRRYQPALHIVYTSGYSPDLAGKPEPAGPGTGFIAKPFDIDSLVRTVRATLDARRS